MEEEESGEECIIYRNIDTKTENSETIDIDNDLIMDEIYDLVINLQSYCTEHCLWILNRNDTTNIFINAII